MQALIMAHDPASQVPESGDDGQDDEKGVDRLLPIQVD